MTGVVLSVEAGKQTLSVSCDSVPGFVPAMVMAFTVKDAALLANVRPGAAIEFTVAIDGSVSNIERLRVRRYQSLESKPSEYRRLELLSQLAGGEAVKRLEPGQVVPDFTLTDLHGKPGQLRDILGGDAAQLQQQASGSSPIIEILSSPMAKAVLAGIASMVVKRVMAR